MIGITIGGTNQGAKRPLRAITLQDLSCHDFCLESERDVQKRRADVQPNTNVYF
jgi:hypothetical protein